MRVITIVMMLCLLVFSGCASGGNQNGANLGFGSSFQGGDEGIVALFETGMPPSTIRDGGLQPFTIRLRLENKGESDVEGGYVVISGLEPNELGVGADALRTRIPAMRGVKVQSGAVRPGAISFAVFNGLKYTQNIGSGALTRNVFATICYPYESRAVSLLCIKGDTTPAVDSGLSSICEIQGQKQVANSGGLVKVENVQEYPFSEHSVQFQFDVVKKTDTQTVLVQSGSIDEQCRIKGTALGSAQASQYVDRVKYTVDIGDNLNARLHCEGQGRTGEVLLSSGSYTVTCIVDTQGEREYERPTVITLDYEVANRQSKDIQIQHFARN